MSDYDVTIELRVRVNLNGAAGERSVDRYVENEDGIQDYLYGPMTREQVLAHLAYNVINASDASYLDGWADLPRGTVTMTPLGCDLAPLFIDEVVSS